MGWAGAKRDRAMELINAGDTADAKKILQEIVNTMSGPLFNRQHAASQKAREHAANAIQRLQREDLKGARAEIIQIPET